MHVFASAKRLSARQRGYDRRFIPFAKNSRTHSDDARPLAAVRNVALTLIRPAGLYVPEGRENFREGRASSISLVTGRVL